MSHLYWLVALQFTYPTRKWNKCHLLFTILFTVTLSMHVLFRLVFQKDIKFCAAIISQTKLYHLLTYCRSATVTLFLRVNLPRGMWIVDTDLNLYKHNTLADDTGHAPLCPSWTRERWDCVRESTPLAYNGGRIPYPASCITSSDMMEF